MIPDDRVDELVEFANDIAAYDFLSQDKTHFCMHNKGINSTLMLGKWSKKVPFVTVVVTTYKRPILLKECIESILNQRNYDDFEIVVMDNDFENYGQKTDSYKVVEDMCSDKVIYFQNSQSADWREDQGVKMARTPWIIFLHDDDVLHSDALYILTNVVKKNGDVKWLSVEHDTLYMNKNTHGKQSKEYSIDNVSIEYYAPSYACYGYAPYWQGSIINREAYIDVGGMMSKRLGCGDMLSVPLFSVKYPIWILEGVGPLYFYRKWEGQDSSQGNLLWTKNYIAEFLFFKFINHKFHRWARIYDFHEWKHITEKAYNNEFDNSIDICDIAKYCDIPDSWMRDSLSSRLLLKTMNFYYWRVRQLRRIHKRYYRVVRIDDDCD